jgi:hypothetical protein
MQLLQDLKAAFAAAQISFWRIIADLRARSSDRDDWAPLCGTDPVLAMAGEGQWQRVTGFLGAVIRSRDAARSLQAAAATQLDAASYSMHLLWEELSAVMPVARPVRAALSHAPEAHISTVPAAEALAA